MPPIARPYSDIGSGLPPGPRPFNRNKWDNPVRFPLHQGDEFDAENYAELCRRWPYRVGVSAADFYFGGSSIEWKSPAVGAMIGMPLPSGDFEAVLELQAGNTIATFDDMFGLAILNAAGNGVGFSVYNDGNAYTWQVVGFNYSSTGNNVASPVTYDLRHIWIAIRKTGTNVQGRVSNDGATWTALTTAVTISGTPIQLAIGRFSGGSGAKYHQLHRLNTYPGPTFFTG